VHLSSSVSCIINPITPRLVSFHPSDRGDLTAGGFFFAGCVALSLSSWSRRKAAAIPNGWIRVKNIFQWSISTSERTFCGGDTQFSPLSLRRSSGWLVNLPFQSPPPAPLCEFDGSSWSPVHPVIDDLLPFRPNGSRMCMTSRGRRDIWPSLVEKAVCNGVPSSTPRGSFSHSI
jgi:hypothetical protein